MLVFCFLVVWWFVYSYGWGLCWDWVIGLVVMLYRVVFVLFLVCGWVLWVVVLCLIDWVYCVWLLVVVLVCDLVVGWNCWYVGVVVWVVGCVLVIVVLVWLVVCGYVWYSVVCSVCCGCGGCWLLGVGWWVLVLWFWL